MATTVAPPVKQPEAPPMQRGEGRAVLTGNEMIVKGALEGGVSLITGYPGSPVAEVFSVCEQIAPYLLEFGVEATLANNEAQSGAMLNGARQVPGARAMTVFKSVGAYVATDALAIANASRPAKDGAAVVVVGDDPSFSSTQTGADSRITLSGVYIPVLEPSSNQEIKDYVAAAFDLSARSGLIVGVVITTTQADGGGVVDVNPNRPPAVGPLRRIELDTSRVRVGDVVSLPPFSPDLQAEMVDERLPAIQALAAERGMVHFERPWREPVTEIGFVTAGACYPMLRESLGGLGLDGRVPILRLGMTWPADAEAIRAFADTVDEIVVMEERRGFLEDQVRSALEGRRQAVWGKRFPEGRGFPETSGIDPDKASAAVERLVRSRPGAFGAEAVRLATEAADRRARLRARALQVIPRGPTYCAGCPHRGTNSPMIEIRKRLRDPDYMRRVHGRGPIDIIAHGGIGCYSMAFLPPFEEMHNLSAMGLGGATGAGAAPHVTNKHYVLVGDGTFFHGEISTVANAIKQDQDILFIILDNKNTAMTGHQGTPGSDVDLMGRPQRPLEIHKIVEAMNPRFLARSNPDDREAHMGLLERAFLMDGTRVVIADKECAITSGRRRKAARAEVVKEKGFLPEITRYNIAEDVCENCRECTKATGCPGLTLTDTALGQKVAIEKDVCVDDGYCAKIKACPSFELVTVKRSQAPAPRSAATDLTPPEDPEVDSAGMEEYAIYLAGIGGMGIGLVARILTEAAADAWADVEVYHKKGIAQRGGGVFSHIRLHDGHRPLAPEIAEGGADLVLGLDAVEGARSLVYASPDHSAAVLNTARLPTTRMLTGQDDYPEDLVETASAQVKAGGLLATDFAEASGAALGDRIYANIAMLGAAYQRGWLPIARDALERAIRNVTSRQAEPNLRAFLLGRVLAAEGARALETEPVEAVLERERGWIRTARQRAAFDRGVERARAAGLGDEALRMLAIRLPDLAAWGGAAYVDRFLAGVERVAAGAPALVPPAIHNLHRVMAIKDEVFVAHQLTSAKKYARDAERFGVDPARGDRISYVHLNRPAFEILGRHVEFDLRARDWMLRLARRGGWARRLMPKWHLRERQFRDWYVDTVLEAVASGRLTGAEAEEAVRLPETVTGFRQVRYPKEDAARARFATLAGAAS